MPKVAIPVYEGLLSPHFGHCSEFHLFDCDIETREIYGFESIPAPPHQPGLLPRWLKERGVDVLLGGGMGHRAIQLMDKMGINVITGLNPDKPEQVVEAYLQGDIQPGNNLCSHGPDHTCEGHQ
jgi:predicted Fe-Mo cluster-binding NifX family protein